MRKKRNYYPEVRGTIIKETYKKGKLVERKKLNNSILNEWYWRSWSDFDRDFGKTLLRSSVDHRFGTKLVDYYSTSHKDNKVVYRRDFGSKHFANYF